MLSNIFLHLGDSVPFWITIVVGVLVGMSAGFVGSFVVLRKMSLSGDALTHVALPGMGLAIFFGLSPFLGAWVFLMIAVLGMWWIGRKTKLSLDAVAGIFFTISLAVGILIIPEIDLLEALFGDIQKLTVLNSVLAIVFSVAVLVSLFFLFKKLILFIISEDLAKTNGIKVSRLDLIFLVLLGVVVALGVQIVGALLMGALVIIPAATAKNMSRSFLDYALFSVIFGGASVLLAFPLAAALNFSLGPMVVLVAALFYLISLLFYWFNR